MHSAAALALALALLILPAGCSQEREAPASSGNSQATPARQVPATPRLAIQGATFRTGSGQFHWRGISAFRLLELMVRGEDIEVEEFLSWASSQDLTVVRVLSMAQHLFQLSPEEGRKALPRLLERAAAYGLYVEVVALADTAGVQADLDRHVKLVGDIAAHYPNAIVEIANEPGHPTQRPDVHTPERLAKLASSIPGDVVIALGSIEYGDGFAAGDYVTTHLPRDEGGDEWDHVRAVAGGASLIGRFKKPVVSDEPIGAAAEYSRGRRDNDPARFRAAALLTRLAGMGATFHHEGGLHGRSPQGRELKCFQAWNEAWTLLPATVESEGKFEIVRRDEYRRLGTREGWVLLLPTLKEITAIDGWSVAERRDLGGATLVRVSRKS